MTHPDFEIDKEISDAIERVAMRSIVPLVYTDGDDIAIAGTGILVRMQGRSHILTAGHVALKLRQRGSWGLFFFGTWVCAGHGVIAYVEEALDKRVDADVALIRLLDQGAIDNIEARGCFLAEADLDFEPPTDDQRFAFYGYPSAMAEIIDGVLRPQFYLGTTSQDRSPAESDYPIIDGLHLRLRIHGNPIDGDASPAEPPPPLDGISGGGFFPLAGQSIYAHDRPVKVCAVITSVKEDTWVKGTLLGPVLDGLVAELNDEKQGGEETPPASQQHG